MDQYRQLRPGERIGGLPSRPWNKMLGLLKPEADGPTLPGQPDTSVEFLVKNTTASPVPRGGVLKISEPHVPHATNAALFFESDIRKGIAPTAGGPFVITQEPIPAGGFGMCRAMGHTKALVAVGTSGDTHADATTATDKLTSGTSGRARIIYPTTGTGDLWCDILIDAAGGGAGLTHLEQLSGVLGPENFGTWTVGVFDTYNKAGSYAEYLFTGKVEIFYSAPTTAGSVNTLIQLQPDGAGVASPSSYTDRRYVEAGGGEAVITLFSRSLDFSTGVDFAISSTIASGTWAGSQRTVIWDINVYGMG